MNRGRSIAFVLCLAMAISRPAFSVQKDDPLLDQTYNLSQKLGGPERLYYLIELCRVSTQLQPPAARAKEWCIDLYNLASTEQDAKLRAVAQKNAVAFLSYVDAPMAMELLSQINFQRPGPGRMVYEDPRYNAAEMTFVNYLKGKPGDFGLIAAKSKVLGQTGQFPYRAIAAILEQYSKQLTGEINGILKDAIGCYAIETGFYNRDEEFLVLLQSLSHSAAVDPDVAAQAAMAFVQHLKTDPIQLPGDYYGEIHIEPSGKVFPFSDRNAAFLFQAMTSIRQCNSSLATQLIQQDPKLNQATTGKMRYISGGFVQGDPTSAEAAQQHSQWLQESLVNRIKECQTSNPQVAAQFAQRLSNPESRVLGFSAIVSGLASQNKQQALVLYQRELSELANLSSSMSRFRAIAALIPAAYRVGESKEYEMLSSQAFDIGTRFVNEDVKAARIQNRKGFAELRDVVTFTASQPMTILRQKIQRLPDDWLKAYLLVYDVEGHGRPKAQDSAPTACPN